MNAVTSVIAALPEDPTNVARYLMACRLIVTMMAGSNKTFAEPTPPLAEVTEVLDALEASEELARRGGKGMVQQRDVARRKAHNKMTMLKAYVQSVANEDPEKAEAVIQSAGMNVRKPYERTKLPVEVKRGDAPGRVVLNAKALPQPVQYRWQMSTDRETWTDVAETFKTKAVVEGLVPATIYSFRLRTVTSSGASEWSPSVTIVAH